jgi:hypothetical protein
VTRREHGEPHPALLAILMVAVFVLPMGSVAVVGDHLLGWLGVT